MSFENPSGQNRSNTNENYRLSAHQVREHTLRASREALNQEAKLDAAIRKASSFGEREQILNNYKNTKGDQSYENPALAKIEEAMLRAKASDFFTSTSSDSKVNSYNYQSRASQAYTQAENYKTSNQQNPKLNNQSKGNFNEANQGSPNGHDKNQQQYYSNYKKSNPDSKGFEQQPKAPETKNDPILKAYRRVATFLHPDAFKTQGSNLDLTEEFMNQLTAELNRLKSNCDQKIPGSEAEFWSYVKRLNDKFNLDIAI